MRASHVGLGERVSGNADTIEQKCRGPAVLKINVHGTVERVGRDVHLPIGTSDDANSAGNVAPDQVEP